MLALVITRGLLRPKVVCFGVIQGPAIFQSLMDSTFGRVVDPSTNAKFHTCFMDDVTISTEAYQEDTDDMVIGRHITQCQIFLEAARPRNIQFKLSKSKLAHDLFIFWASNSAVDSVL